MPLIVESYFFPYTRISELLFPTARFQYIDSPISEPADEELFCYTRAGDLSRQIQYYFNRIYYIESGKIVCINKTARTIKYYDLETGKLASFSETIDEKNVIDKSDFLPQLQAQNGEFVLFPEEDDEI